MTLPVPRDVLPFESEAAQRLEWLPLAVRFKLDRTGMRVSLAQWQAVPLPQRERLLRSAEGNEFLAAFGLAFSNKCQLSYEFQEPISPKHLPPEVSDFVRLAVPHRQAEVFALWQRQGLFERYVFFKVATGRFTTDQKERGLAWLLQQCP